MTLQSTVALTIRRTFKGAGVNICNYLSDTLLRSFGGRGLMSITRLFLFLFLRLRNSHLVLTRLTRPAFCIARGKTRFWMPRSVTSLDPVMSRYWRTVQFWPRMERIWLSQTPWRTTWRRRFIFSVGNNQYLALGGNIIVLFL